MFCHFPGHPPAMFFLIFRSFFTLFKTRPISWHFPEDFKNLKIPRIGISRLSPKGVIVKKVISFFRSSEELFVKNAIFYTPDTKNTIFTISVPYFYSLSFRKNQNWRSAYNRGINVQMCFFENFFDFRVNFLTPKPEKTTSKNDLFDGPPGNSSKSTPKPDYGTPI